MLRAHLYTYQPGPDPVHCRYLDDLQSLLCSSDALRTHTAIGKAHARHLDHSSSHSLVCRQLFKLETLMLVLRFVRAIRHLE